MGFVDVIMIGSLLALIIVLFIVLVFALAFVAIGVIKTLFFILDKIDGVKDE